MKNREQLHRFIKKLSKSEKRAFKLYVSKYETVKDNKMLQLFNLINKMDVFEESKLYKVSSEKLVTYDLYRLHQYLLNALSDLNFKKEVNNLGEIINRLELGFKYEIPEIIEEELAKGYKLADIEENDFVTLLLAKYEHRFCSFQKDVNRTIKTDEKILKLNKRLETNALYDLMGREVHLWYMNNTGKDVKPLVFSRTELEEVFNGPVEEKETINGTKAFYNAKQLYFDIIKDYESLIKIQEAMFYLLVKLNIDPKKDYSIIQSFYNLVFDYLKLDKLKESEETLAFFKEKYVTDLDLSISHVEEVIYYNAYTNVLYYKKEYQIIVDLVPIYQKYLDPKNSGLNHHLSKEQLRGFCITVLSSYFCLSNYNECLDWIDINSKISVDSNSVHREIDLYMKFLEVLCHFELGHEKMLSSLLNKFYYFITKGGDKDVEEMHYYNILKRLVNRKK